MIRVHVARLCVRFPNTFSTTMATSHSCPTKPTTTSTAKTYRSPKQKMHRIPSRRPRKRAPELSEKWTVAGKAAPGKAKT